MKFCTKCQQNKNISEYGKDRSNKDGLTHVCKSCRNINSKSWRLNNPEKVKELNHKHKFNRKEYYNSSERKLKYRNSELKRTFGITHEDYERMLLSQNGVCKICNQYRTSSDKNYMVIDHCHTSGKIRGILCNKCNTALGSFEDNINFLKNAITYLMENKNENK